MLIGLGRGEKVPQELRSVLVSEEFEDVLLFVEDEIWVDFGGGSCMVVKGVIE